MNVDYYTTLVFLHVASAILAIGPLFIIILIINQLKKVVGAGEVAYLSIINATVRLVMHAGHALVVTGILLILLGPWPWHTSWVIMTIIIMLLSAAFLATGFSKVTRKFNAPNANRNRILNQLKRNTWAYIAIMLILLWLMVHKPILW